MLQQCMVYLIGYSLDCENDLLELGVAAASGLSKNLMKQQQMTAPPLLPPGNPHHVKTKSEGAGTPSLIANT